MRALVAFYHDQTAIFYKKKLMVVVDGKHQAHEQNERTLKHYSKSIFTALPTFIKEKESH